LKKIAVAPCCHPVWGTDIPIYLGRTQWSACRYFAGGLVALMLVTVLVVACTGPFGGGSTDVHMGNINFSQSSVTITKGSSLNLIDDVAVVHLISNGYWKNGQSIPASEPGAPTVNNLQFSSAGESHMIGPFNTAGTFHLYCIIHEDMNLTVIVQ
jgi:plastocyanin